MWREEVTVREGAVFTNKRLRKKKTDRFDLCRMEPAQNAAVLSTLVEGGGALTSEELRAAGRQLREDSRATGFAKGLLVLGEVQLGNWGLAYRDTSKIKAARFEMRDGSIDLFLSIALDGCLHGLISKNTVDFDTARKAVAEAERDLPIPTWVVGVDFDHASGAHPSACQKPGLTP